MTYLPQLRLPRERETEESAQVTDTFSRGCLVSYLVQEKRSRTIVSEQTMREWGGGIVVDPNTPAKSHRIRGTVQKEAILSSCPS